MTMSLFRLSLIAATSAVALSACGPDTPPAAEPHSAPTPTPTAVAEVAEVEDPAIAAARERILGKALCEDYGLDSSIVEPGEDVDCALHPDNATEGGDVRLLVTAAAIPDDAAVIDAGVMRVEVAKLDGTSVQVIEETGLNGYVYPWMADVDGKNGLDLVITREQGNANAQWSIWLSDGKGTYAPAGYLVGVDYQYDASGMIITAARSNAATVNYAFTRVSEDLTFEGVATVETVAQTDANGEFTGAWSCKLLLSEDPSLTEEALCGHPAVTGGGP